MELLATGAHKENFPVASGLFRKRVLLSAMFAGSHFGAQIAQVMPSAQTLLSKGRSILHCKGVQGFSCLYHNLSTDLQKWASPLIRDTESVIFPNYRKLLLLSTGISRPKYIIYCIIPKRYHTWHTTILEWKFPNILDCIKTICHWAIILCMQISG